MDQPQTDIVCVCVCVYDRACRWVSFYLQPPLLMLLLLKMHLLQVDDYSDISIKSS